MHLWAGSHEPARALGIVPMRARRLLLRLLTMAVTLFGVAVVVFVVIRVVPGDPIAMIGLIDDNPVLTEVAQDARTRLEKVAAALAQ